MKLKYQAVINLAKSKGVSLSNVHIEGNKLLIRGAAPSEEIKNEIWGQAKLIDADYADLWLDLSIDPSLAPPVRTYTVEKGDSLWKIAAKHYGNGAQYPKIIAGNPGQLKDENSVIHPGDVLVIPD
ncbi:MAG: LysM peptidoglycan-binding domain-containing protein [Bryobacteraceae bacterium]|jgi:nucleoid-associated protein YgaU|nr:LysM peptidoglycan-binding domain-containing protein [Bryobacteraceae bacterium]